MRTHNTCLSSLYFFFSEQSLSEVPGGGGGGKHRVQGNPESLVFVSFVTSGKTTNLSASDLVICHLKTMPSQLGDRIGWFIRDRFFLSDLGPQEVPA